MTLAITYSRVGVELWGSRAIGEDTSMQHDRVKSKRKVSRNHIILDFAIRLMFMSEFEHTHYKDFMDLSFFVLVLQKITATKGLFHDTM